MGFSFKNLFKKDKPQEDTEHVSLEKSAESDSAKTEARAKHKKGEVVIADSGNVKEVSRVMLKFDQLLRATQEYMSKTYGLELYSSDKRDTMKQLIKQAAAVRDKFEDAIISMCVENYSEMYQPIRESHASSYAFNGTRWEERHKANEQYIRTYLNKAMSAGEIMQCEIVSISFDVDSPSVAPSDTDTAKKYAVSGSITIKVPYRFAWQELAPISLKLDVKSQWRALF